MTSRWADAAREVNSLHAHITRIEYDHVFRTFSRSEGTLNFERPNRCRLELQPVRPSSQGPVEVNGIEYQSIVRSAWTIVWSEEALIVISPNEGLYDRIDIAPSKRVVSEEAKNASVAPADSEIDESVGVNQFEEVLWKLLIAVLFPDSESVASAVPETTTQNQTYAWSFSLSHWEVLPILLSDPATVSEQGYEVLQQGDFRKGLTAFPTEKRENYGFTRINVLFSPETGLPYATQQVGDHRTIVHILKNVELNPRFDRADLFDPSLERLTTYSSAQVSKEGQE